MFELIWSRQLALVLGCTVTSSALVSGVFLMGLGLGARWGERLSRRRNLLRVFAGLELAIAASGLTVVAVLPHMALFVANLAQVLGNLPLARLAVCCLALGLPCLCMGASLPVLCALLSERWGGVFVRSLGKLYAINTLGAVAGVLLCDGVLILRLGIWNTGLVAAGLDASVAVLALFLAGKAEEGPVETPTAPKPVACPVPLGRLYFTCWGMGVAGACLQVAWTRVLIVFQGSDLWAFSGCLATYLACLAGGAALAAVLARYPLALLGVLWSACLTSLLSLASLPWARGITQPWLANLLVIAPTALALGVAFPLVCDEVKKHVAAVADCAGWALLYNTLGSLVGALLTAFVLIPGVGLQYTFGLASLWLAVLALLLYPRGRALIFSIVLTAMVVATLVTVSPTYLRGLFFPTPGLQFLFTGEDAYGSVALVRDPENTVQLLVDGFNMMSNDRPTQRYATALAAFPCLWQERADNALVICLGLAHSTNFLLRTPLTRSVDCVELSPTVVRAIDTIPQGREALTSPKLRLKIGDGRHHLVSTSQNYQVITAEPPPPTRAGAVNLYTRDYYELCAARLVPGGICVQWMPVFQMSNRQTRTILRAFQEVFPESYLVEGCGAQLCLLGSKTPIRLDYSALEQRVEASNAALTATGWDSPEFFVASVLAGPKTLAEYTRQDPPLTDDWPVLQYSREAWDPDFDFLLLQEHPQELSVTYRDEAQRQAVARAHRCLAGLRIFLCQDWVEGGRRGLVEREVLARMAVRNYPDNSYFRWVTRTRDLDTETFQRAPESAQMLWDLARVHFRSGRNAPALETLQRLGAAALPEAVALECVILWESGQLPAARQLFDGAQTRMDPRDREYLQRLFAKS